MPSALEGDRLTVAFPPDAAFLKKKAEANRELVLGALRSLTGRAPGGGLRAQRDGRGPGPVTLGEEELLERLKRDFGAEEVFEDARTPEPRTETCPSSRT